MLPRLNISGYISFLVDTGADTSLLNPIDSKRLGIDFNTLTGDEESWGLGGSVHSYVEDALLIFSETGVALYVYSFDLSISPDDPAIPADLPSLLGRDVIDNWRMTYSPSRQNLTFHVFSADVTIPL